MQEEILQTMEDILSDNSMASELRQTETMCLLTKEKKSFQYRTI